jgi:hypothetical protein
MIYCNFGISALRIGENADELEGNKRVGVIWSERKLRTYVTLRTARVTGSLYGVESLDIAFWRVHGEVRGRVEYRRCLALTPHATVPMTCNVPHSLRPP